MIQTEMSEAKILQRFQSQESCIAHLESIRWRGGKPTCPYCGSLNTTRREHRHRCYQCVTSFSVTVGTAFHQTHIPLQKWFLAIMLTLDADDDLPASQLARDLNVNKNTACRMTKQIRNAISLADQRDFLKGIAEIGEFDGGCLVKASASAGRNDREIRN